MQLSSCHFQPSGRWTVLMTSWLLATLLCSSGLARAAAPPTGSNKQPPDFTILTPRFGSSQTRQVEVTLQYVTQNEDPTVKVQLNGRALKDGRLTKACQGTTCTVTSKLTRWDGLRVGENTLSATLTGRLHLPTLANSSSTPVLLERTKFDYFQPGLLTSGAYNAINYYEPASVGLSTVPGGGANNTWLQLTTGYLRDWNTTADAYAFPSPPGSNNTVTIPYPDVNWPINCPGWTFQALVLNRQNPSVQETGTCFNNVSDLAPFAQTNLGRPLGSQDLVVMGTTPDKTAPAGLDTSSLGGNNYSSYPASTYPQAYIIIGVPGATPGTAYDSFNVSPSNSHPDTSYLPSLNGTLMQDQNGNYNFIPSGDTTFQVHSDTNTGLSSITVGNNTYTVPAGTNYFWLLVLDRETLTPVNNYNYAPDSMQDCSATATMQSCGATYSVASDGGNRLAAELSSTSDHDLIFLVSQGCPVENTSQMQSGLGDVLHSIGGAPYAVNTMNTGAQSAFQCNYSLVTVNDTSHWHPLNDPVALSAAVFGTNGQHGSLQGYLGRNGQGLYDVAGKAQMVPNSDGSALAPPIDYTFGQVASSPRQDWPLVDTAFLIEAYADVSYQILTALGETGSRLYDVRYFYTSSSFLTDTSLGGILTNNLGTVANPATSPFTKKSWDNASPTQFTAALQQIGTELQQATSAYGYLGPADVRGQMASSDFTIYADMIGMAKTVSNDYSQASSASADTKLSQALNLTGSIVGLGSILPGIGPIMGVVGGALRVGSGAIALGGDSIPSPYAVFDDSLSNFTTDATTYISNLTLGFDGAVDNILSDGGKLSTIGTLTLNSDSAWKFPTQISQDQLQTPLVDGAARSIWLDVIPQLFGIRQYLGASSNNPRDYGVNYTPDGYNFSVCENQYQGVASASYGAYFSVDNNQRYDLYVFAEGPQGSSGSDTTVSGTLASLLTTPGSSTINGNQQGNLNLPTMLLYGYSNMTYGPFQPIYGYKPSDVTYCPRP